MRLIYFFIYLIACTIIWLVVCVCAEYIIVELIIKDFFSEVYYTVQSTWTDSSVSVILIGGFIIAIYFTFSTRE